MTCPRSDWKLCQRPPVPCRSKVGNFLAPVLGQPGMLKMMDGKQAKESNRRSGQGSEQLSAPRLSTKARQALAATMRKPGPPSSRHSVEVLREQWYEHKVSLRAEQAGEPSSQQLREKGACGAQG